MQSSNPDCGADASGEDEARIEEVGDEQDLEQNTHDYSGDPAAKRRRAGHDNQDAKAEHHSEVELKR